MIFKQCIHGYFLHIQPKIESMSFHSHELNKMFDWHYHKYYFNSDDLGNTDNYDPKCHASVC